MACVPWLGISTQQRLVTLFHNDIDWNSVDCCHIGEHIWFYIFYMCFYTTRAMFWGIMKQLHHIKTLSMHWWKRNSQLPRRKNGCYNKRQGDLWIAILSAIDSLCEMHMCLWGNNTTKVSSIVSGEENAMSKGCWLNATWVGTAELFKPVDKQSEAREVRWPRYEWT